MVAARNRLPVVDVPRTVGDCRGTARPCHRVQCKFNLLLDIKANGAIAFNARFDGAKEGMTRWINRSPENDERFAREMEASVEAWFADPDNPPPSCLIDEVEVLRRVGRQRPGSDETILEHIAERMFLTGEGCRQTEVKALLKLMKALIDAGVDRADLAVLDRYGSPLAEVASTAEGDGDE